jgi:alanine racemase
MPRSLVTVDLAAIRHNVLYLRGLLDRAELWAVVKADAYGHGAVPVAAAALEAGATALLVATVAEAGELRRALPSARILVLGPLEPGEAEHARSAGLELCVSSLDAPGGIPLHLKLDTGMGRWGLSEAVAPGPAVVGLMSHFACSESDPEFTGQQLERFLAATAPYSHLTRHIANSAATLCHPAARLDAVRCGIAVYGISPFGTEAAVEGLRPALRWESTVAQERARATAGASWQPRRRGSGSCPSATRTGSGATSPGRRSSSRESVRRSSGPSPWMRSRSPCPPARARATRSRSSATAC